MKPIISIRCGSGRHSWSAMASLDYKCNGNAYTGKLTDPPVPCQCNCHYPGARKPDDDVK